MKAKEKHDELLAEAPAAQQIITPDGWPADALSWMERRAYELWQARGCRSGRELDDWLQAEAEIKATLGTLAPDETSGSKQPGYSRRATAR